MGADEVQSCSGNGACSGDISRILRYLRFYKDYIEILHNYPSIKFYSNSVCAEEKACLFGEKRLYTAVIWLKINIKSLFDIAVGHILPFIVKEYE